MRRWPVETNKIILEARGLKKYFEKPGKKLFSREKEVIKAVDDVSFDVRKGTTLGIVGESGSGKSTVARLVNRLITPTAGSVRFHDAEITAMSGEELRKLRRQIQMVFQSPFGTLDPRKSIGYSLREPFIIHTQTPAEEQKRKVQELLDLVGLPHWVVNKYPHEFSGGQLQRINIARAIALHPEIIICDESVSALDVSIQAQILNLLKDLQKELNLTYLFISHDLNVVRYFCDDVLVMHYGKVVEQGTSKEVYEHPREEYTKNLLASIPAESPYEVKGE